MTHRRSKPLKSLPKDLPLLMNLLLEGQHFLSEPLLLALPGFSVRIHCNHKGVYEGLLVYFRPFVAPEASERKNVVELHVVESNEQPLQLSWLNWAREPGKKGRKDSYLDLTGNETKNHARLINKVRTGMLFVQSLTSRIAFGPCLNNLNQVINFINNQFINHLQHYDWLICHAASVQKKGSGIAFAGFSGGGKSTTMLHLLNQQDFKYVTNDRLFIKYESNASVSQVNAQGIPKLPRVNPGTLLNNDSLANMLSDEQKLALREMPLDELWQLEQKYDVDIVKVYGHQQELSPHPLKHLVILNWHRNNKEETKVSVVNLRENLGLLEAVMKSRGPFYQDATGKFDLEAVSPEPLKYLSTLEQITVWQVTGGVDFDKVVRHCEALIPN